MITRLSIWSLVLTLTSLVSTNEVRAQTIDNKWLDGYINQALRKWELPGLAISVVKGNETLLAKGYGVQTRGKNTPIDKNTLFAIGSNTKAFTTTAIGLLVKENKLSLDDRATDHLKGFELYDPYVTRELTIRDMLCHRSGLGTWEGDLIFWGSNYSRTEVLHRLRYLKPSSSFRSRFGYSNIMFIAAGQVIPSVSGVEWGPFLRSRLLDPLDMKRTTTSSQELAGRANIATPHERIDGSIIPIAHRNLDNGGPAGSMYSSAADMAKWIRLQLGGGMYEGKTIVPVDVITEMRKPHTVIPVGATTRKLLGTNFLAYGLSWNLTHYRGRFLVNHGGGVDGMLSRVALLPDEQLGVVVLTNSGDNALSTALSYEIFDHLLGVKNRKWKGYKATNWSDLYLELRTAGNVTKKEPIRVTGTTPSLPLKSYAGEYQNELYGDVRIEYQDGRLSVRFLPHPDILEGTLDHWHHDSFHTRWKDVFFGESILTFILDKNGEIDAFRVSIRPDWIDPLEYEFVRVNR